MRKIFSRSEWFLPELARSPFYENLRECVYKLIVDLWVDAFPENIVYMALEDEA